ncbi:MAG: hypothetical protein WCP98_17645 [Actinomycetes bacterium]
MADETDELEDSMRKIAIVAGLLALLATGCLSIACGGESGKLPATFSSPSATADRFKLQFVKNTEYAFRMAYPSGWLHSTWQREAGSKSVTSLQFMLSYADPKGAQVGGSYVDAEQVAVHRLSRAVSPGEVSQETATDIIHRVMLQDLPGLSVRSAPLKVDVHGDAGWHVEYAYRIGDTTIWAQSILVLKGKYAYWATGQASSYNMRTQYATLATALAYFRVD